MDLIQRAYGRRATSKKVAVIFGGDRPNRPPPAEVDNADWTCETILSPKSRKGPAKRLARRIAAGSVDKVLLLV